MRNSEFSIQLSAFGLFSPPEVISAIRAMKAPIMIGHVVPDADAVGAMFSMALAWTSDRRRPKVSLPPGSLSQRLTFLFELAQRAAGLSPRGLSASVNPVQAQPVGSINFRAAAFMPPTDQPDESARSESCGSGIEVASVEDFKSADGFVVVDTAKKPRCCVGPTLKDTDWIAGRPLVNIDHHATNTHFGDVNWVVETAGSSCELVYAVLKAADRPITPAVASLLYAGMLTDTLGFSLPSINASALRACAELVECGADIGLLGERLFRSQTKSEFELLRTVYDNTRVLAEGRLAYSSLSFDEIQRAGCKAADIDDQINVPRSLDGVQLALLFSEGHKGETRINFRSSGPVMVVELAAEFKGGGHLQASGAIMDCGLHEALERVIPRAIEHLQKFPT